MSIFKKFNDLVFGPDDEEEEVADYFTAETPRTEAPAPVPTTSTKKPKVVNIAATTQLKVVVLAIEKFDEAKDIVDHLNNKKPVVVNFERLSKDVAKKSFDFINGAVYALGANIQKVSSGIFLIAPYNVDILSFVRQEITNSGTFSWEEDDQQ